MFGETVRFQRRRLGLTQEDLAARTGLGIRSIRDIESGLTRRPRPSTIRLLADAFELRGAGRDRFQSVALAQADRSPSTSDDEPTEDEPRVARYPHPRRPTPAQLPADLSGFIGRLDQLRQLDTLLEGSAAHASAALAVSAITGTAGVGKTTLAVHWAHRVAGQFPDGQLYVNLRGFDPRGRAMAPAEAVRGFLDAFGVPPDRIPPDLDVQAALYRSLLNGKRVLVVLDNARDADQVQPLLPGVPGCLVVVTSRNQLTSLVATNGAHPLTLDLLSTVEARELLGRRLSADRIAAEPEATKDLITVCARLPLALSIAAARIQLTGFSLTVVASELGTADHRSGTVSEGEPGDEVRTVFSWSYAGLPPASATLFRLLGLHPGPDIAAPAAASLLGQPLAETRRLLMGLVRANLLAEHAPGRYRFHDLLRAYATDLSHRHDPTHKRHAATVRLLDHYTRSAYAADRLLDPYRDPIALPLTPPAADTSPERLDGQQQAMAWLNAEYRALLAAIRQFADTGLDLRVWQLAWVLDTFLYRRGHRHDRAFVWQTALPAACRLDDLSAQNYAHRALANASILLGRYDDAQTHLRDALDGYGRARDRIGLGHTHRLLGLFWERQGHVEKALDHSQQSLALYQAVDNRAWEAVALNMVGWYYALLGRQTQTLTYCKRALTLLRQLDRPAREAEAHTWDSLGFAHYQLGRPADAVVCYKHTVELCREIGDRYGEATALVHLGDAYRAGDEPAAACASWTQAVRILTGLGHPDVTNVHAKLDDLDRRHHR